MKLTNSLPLLGLAHTTAGHPALRALSYGNATSRPCETVQCHQDALSFAFTYGFPLYPYGALTQGEDAIPTNRLIHQSEPRTSDNREIVRPNVDTLYSTVFIDLSTHDLEITVPNLSSRYLVWPFYDLYGNNFANVGNNANVTCGKILVRYDQTNIGAFPKGTIKAAAGYDGYIGAPTPYGINIVRVEGSNTPEDLEAVHAIQSQMQIRPIPRPGPPAAPPLDLDMFKNSAFLPSNGTSLPEAVFRLTAALAHFNEPEIPADRPIVAQTLANAGIRNGIWTQPPGTNLTAAVAASNASVASYLSLPGSNHTPSNNWTVLDSAAIGDYDSLYQMRYFVAGWGYLGLTDDQCMYPSYTDIQEIGSNQAILFQFSGRPAVREVGFWSLTLYGADQFLVPNDLDRYALGDRSNLTFPSGELVYSSKGEETDDGVFEILVQPTDVVPPANWTGNWLPAPAGGGGLDFTLRWYGPEEAMLPGGEYAYPKVTLIDAITA
ncbi:hypothetical protein BDV95DRAFT_600949 [Massariosphaeria phaeospora]|uniref:DUF1254 domain-containing protein n=1 Tax=Massariosphaeria phaeospora TaxID=100035 RepID=A0A7C8MPD2_9PLEO|nr:hypothetical protein BDV95DRAFT_600949 [Massariosphaeria phaeospora]